MGTMSLPEDYKKRMAEQMKSKPLPEEIKARIEANLRKLTPEQITEELKKRAAKVKKRLRQLEEAKKISPEIWNMRIDYQRSRFV